MKMSDKDFDQLFNSKLANMEAEPSPMVWNNITAELDGPAKSKMRVVPFMRIAASFVILMGASLFFMRPAVQKVTLHGSGDVSTVEQSQPQLQAVNKAAVNQLVGKVNNIGSQSVSVVKRFEKGSGATLTKEIKNAVDTTQILADVNKKLTENAKANAIALQQQSLQQAAVNSTNISQPKTTVAEKQPVLANIPTIQKPDEMVRKKRIRSLGDLLNVVIAQVDKRKDKIVEFTNDRDDDSFNITGINLGILGAKKDK